MKYLHLIFLSVIVSNVYAQSFSDLNDRKDENLYDNYTLQVFLRYTNFSDPYTKTIKGTGANASFRVGRSGKGEVNWNFENPTLGDMIYVLSHLNKTKDNIDKAFGSGFFGWHQIYFNAMVGKKLIIAPGFSTGDYILGLQQPKLQVPDKLYYEPNGYYFHLGPAVKASYLISKKMWVEGYLHTDIGFRVGDPPSNLYQRIEGYERPIFLNFGATLFHTSRLFGGFRVCNLIDRGVNNAKATRLDISAGYMFKM